MRLKRLTLVLQVFANKPNYCAAFTTALFCLVGSNPEAFTPLVRFVWVGANTGPDPDPWTKASHPVAPQRGGLGPLSSELRSGSFLV